MHKKLMLACMAIAAFAAFVIAPMASAATLTEGGVAVMNGASITGAASETKFLAGANTVVCSNAHMSGSVTTNANGEVNGEIAAGNPSFTGTAAASDCTGGNLGPVKPTVNSALCLHIAKGTDIGSVTGCRGASVTFTLNVTNLGLLCHYEKASIGAEITTEGAGTPKLDAAVKILKGEKALREGTNAFCPAEGELEMEFTLTTTDGTTLTFS